MKSIGSLLFIFGAITTIYGFMDRAPKILHWIYGWGETTAWIIKIGLMVLGAALYIIGSRKKAEANSQEQ